jgi:hypothetical protein
LTPSEAQTQTLGEVTWYSRLATWAGALVLLVQSVTGRSTGIMTLIGVILLAGGFTAFLSGLVSDSRRVLATPLSDMEPAPSDVGEVAPPDTAETEQPLVEGASEPLSASRVHAEVSARPLTIVTEEVTAASSLCGTSCQHCGREIAPGQMAARCPLCGAAHHGACWIDNRFHCSTPGCPGHGNLVAPDETEPPEGE